MTCICMRSAAARYLAQPRHLSISDRHVIHEARVSHGSQRRSAIAAAHSLDYTSHYYLRFNDSVSVHVCMRSAAARYLAQSRHLSIIDRHKIHEARVSHGAQRRSSIAAAHSLNYVGGDILVGCSGFMWYMWLRPARSAIYQPCGTFTHPH